MKTLIITVGTRQVGWRCQDGIVRCFGADGDRGHPPHINELYRELGQERSFHDPENAESRWGVCHLGEQYYEWCEVEEDYSRVELLLDHKIIADEVQQGLDHIILWGTNQPETVSWSFRRADTLWLAELMAGKIRQVYPHLDVDVWNPVVPANQPVLIRQEVEGFILKYALDRLDPNLDQPFVLVIENKGSAPAIANTLEICAAGLVRECEVKITTPVEPDPLYLTIGGARSAQLAEIVESVAIGEYFWSLERRRILSAWERGDFQEAHTLLAAHQTRYPALYRLADCLALSTNWQVAEALQRLRAGWVNSKALRQVADPEQIQIWQQQLTQLIPVSKQLYTLEQRCLQAWEFWWLVKLLFKRQNYTGAFLQFAQTLERLLFVQYQAEQWVSKGYLTPPEKLQHLREQWNPALGGLIRGWQLRYQRTEQDKWYQLLERIREKRNEITHLMVPITLSEICMLWTKEGLFSVQCQNDAEVLDLMQQTLNQVVDKKWRMPESLLLQSLHEWGNNLLK